MPAYEPSTTVSQAPHSLILTSSDSVAKIGAFYAGKLAGEGWTFVSKVLTPTSASFTIKKGSQGATITVSPRASSSSITISTYQTY